MGSCLCTGISINSVSFEMEILHETPTAISYFVCVPEWPLNELE